MVHDVLATDYPSIFQQLLSPLATSRGTISREDLFASPQLGTVKDATKLKHLKAFISQNPKFIGVVEGVLPETQALLDLIEAQLGAPVSENNVVRANEICTEIVGKITRPVFEGFLRNSLGGRINGEQVELPLAELLEFLLQDYGPFNRKIGNGLVSVAGEMNEWLLLRCLENAGLKSEEDFEKTGTDSNADIIIFAQNRTRQNLGVEVKSYHARERLLRGLQDITGQKVGAGFFVDPSEFSEARTETLLQTGAAAIYMPHQTIQQLERAARAMTTSHRPALGSKFYRPLETFASDMVSFRQRGVLPRI